MIKKIYAVYDKKAKTELNVFEGVNDLVAIRDFSQICSNPEHQICKFAEDYCLMSLGTIDTETGAIVSEIKTIAEATDYAKKE